MPDTGHASKQDPIAEAQALVDRLLPVVGRLRDKQRDFVTQMAAKLKQYGPQTYVSDAQLEWLRALDKSHAPDERQGALF